MPLNLIVTNAGRAALVNLPNTGTNALTIATIGVSPNALVPTADVTVLPGELKRIAALSGDVVADDTIHMVMRDEGTDAYACRSFALYLTDGTLFAVYGQATDIFVKTAQSIALLANDIRFVDVDANDLAFGDVNFLNPPATTDSQGVVELATDAETTTGIDAQRAVTPKAARAAFLSWLNDRIGAAAPSDIAKTILALTTAAAIRLELGLKSAALKDEGAGGTLDADLLDGQHGAYYANIPARLGYTPWGPNNDGSGSGLDADLLDGRQASEFALLSGAAFAGTVAFNAAIVANATAIFRAATEEKTRLVGVSPFLAAFNASETTRYGYIQWGAGAVNLASETGTIDLYADGGLRGRFSAAGLSVTGGASISGTGYFGSRVGIGGAAHAAALLDVHGDQYVRGTLYPESLGTYSGDLPVDLGGNAMIWNVNGVERGRINAGGFSTTNTNISNYSTWLNGGAPVGDIGKANSVLSGGSSGDFGITSRGGHLRLGANTVTIATITTLGLNVAGVGEFSGKLSASDGGIAGPSAHFNTTVGGAPCLRLTSSFVGGNAVDLNPFITGTSNGGFEILVAGVRRFWLSTDGSAAVNGALTAQGIVYAAGFTRAGNTVWDSGNDGSGSGLDADTVDGWHRDDLRAWGNLLNKPATFPPSAHTHAPGDITGMPYVVASSSVPNGGYRIWSDGYKECWGAQIISGNGNTVIYFPISFNSYSQGFVNCGRPSLQQMDNDPYVETSGLNSMTIYSAIDFDEYGNWRAHGY